MDNDSENNTQTSPEKDSVAPFAILALVIMGFFALALLHSMEQSRTRDTVYAKEASQNLSRTLAGEHQQTSTVISEKKLQVVDGDTFYYDGILYHLYGIDAPEITQKYGEESKRQLESFLRSGDITITPVKRDKYGRTIAKVHVNGEDISLKMVEFGNAWHYESEQSEISNKFRIAQDAARKAGLGLFGEEGGVKDGSVNAPSGYRRSDFSAYQQERFKRVCKMELDRMRKVMTPEAMEALAKSAAMDLKEKNEAYRKLVAKSAPVKGVAGIVAELGMLGFDWERRGVDVDDIPVYRLNWVLKRMQDEFGYTAADFANEGFKNPYDAARQYVKNAMNIIRTDERRQKRFRELSPAEQQQEMNEYFFGDAKEKHRWFGHEEVKSYMDSMTFKGVVEQAFENGMTAKAVVTAAFMALSEHQDEKEHQARLSVMPPDEAQRCEDLVKKLRAQRGFLWGLFD